MIGWNSRRVVLAAMVTLFLWHPVASATVYAWKGEGGVRMLSNDPNDVPPEQQASAEKFTAKPAPRSAPDDAAPPPPGAGAAAGEAYERGFDAGRESAEHEVALATELARTMVASAPQAPPAPIFIEQPEPAVVPDVASYYPPPYYGAGYYPPYPFPYYGLGVSVISHRRPFSGGRGHRFTPTIGHGAFELGPFGRMR